MGIRITKEQEVHDGEKLWRIKATWDSKHGGTESHVRFAKTLVAQRRIVYGFKMKFRMGEYD
jgi:hypothetical protein